MAIAGFFKKREDSPDSNRLLNNMVKKMRFRKDDQVEYWKQEEWLAARVHHGIVNQKQPILNEDKTIGILMDGEVYGYTKEKVWLENLGHRFQYSENDAEYCLHLFEEEGIESLKKLNGSFCILIYIINKKEVCLITDRYSSRPLFYYFNKKGELFFSSLIASLLQVKNISRKIHLESVFELFTFQRISGNKTLYHNIQSIPPGTVLRCHYGKVDLIPYFKITYNKINLTISDYTEQMANILKKSVERRLKGNYRIGLLLSGGLDSRLVLSLVDRKISCFTFGYIQNREVRITEKIARTLGCPHHFIRRRNGHYFNLMDDSVDIINGMNSLFQSHNIGFLEEISQHCQILFHGFWAGVVLKGISIPKKEIVIRGKRKKIPLRDHLEETYFLEKVIRKMKGSTYYQKPWQIFKEPYKKLYNQYIRETICRTIKEQVSPTNDLYDRWEYLCFSHNFSRLNSFPHFSSILPYMDERNIYIDNDVTDLYFKTPSHLRSNSQLHRAVLKKLLPREIAHIPDSNTGLSPFINPWLSIILLSIPGLKEIFCDYQLPRSNIPQYVTHWSWPNVANLIRYNKPIREKIEKCIDVLSDLEPGLFQKEIIRRIFLEHIQGKANYDALLAIFLTFSMWSKKYGFEITLP